ERWAFEHAGADFQAALADQKVGFVIITSPREQRTEQVIRSIHADKEVIVEIPAGLSLREAERVAQLSMQSRRRVLGWHPMRSFPAIGEVRRRVASGRVEFNSYRGLFCDTAST